MTGDLESYLRYKPSGVEWLEEVPAHWETRRLRNVARTYFSNVDKLSKDEEHTIRLCNYSDVYHNDCIRADMEFMEATATAEEIERFRIHADDMLITKDSESWDDIGVSAFVESTDYDLVCGYHLALLRPLSGELYGKLLCRALSVQGIAGQLFARANEITRYGLSQVAIRSVWLPIPPLTEQVAIARYLDHMDRRIVRYIDIKKKLIELLEEYRQVLVSDAVTGRFDVRTGKPYPTYKPSGIEWLGDVPAHWEVRCLGQIGAFSKGSGGSKEDEFHSGVPCVRYGDLYTTHRHFIEKSRSFVPPERAAKYTPIKFGDLLFAASGETIEEIGKSAVNLIPSGACCGGDVILFRSRREIEARFLGYAADCRAATTQKATMGRGFTVIQIYASQLKRLGLALPPLTEQAAIAYFLDKKIEKIRKGIAQAQSEIDLLREYRTRLIADVVTGKLDVREAATALPEFDLLAADDRIDDLPDTRDTPASRSAVRPAEAAG